MRKGGKAGTLGITLLPLGGALLAAALSLNATSEAVQVLSAMACEILLFVFAVVGSRRSIELETARLRRRKVDQLCQSATDKLGLAVDEAASAGGRRLRGHLDGVDVSVVCTPSDSSAETSATSISVQIRHPRLAEIGFGSRWKAPSIVRRGAAAAPAMALVETGAEELDKLLAVRGRLSTALAILTPPVRSALVNLGSRGVLALSQGCLTFETNDLPSGLEELQSLIASTIAAAKIVAHAATDDVPGALAKAACDDPEPGVRAQALRTLVAELGDHPATGPALQRALSDGSDAVRVVAASALGEPGVPVLQDIASSRGSEEDAAARAINILGRRLTTENLLGILDSAPRAGRLMVTEAAVAALGRPGDVPACARLAEVLRDADAPLAVAAATALARSALPDAERSLIAALGSTWAGVRRAAACALEDAGGSEALVALHALLGRETNPADVGTRRAAQRAIARIRQRVPDLGPGHVSLAAPQGGDLAVSDIPGQGRVTLSEDW